MNNDQDQCSVPESTRQPCRLSVGSCSWHPISPQNHTHTKSHRACFWTCHATTENLVESGSPPDVGRTAGKLISFELFDIELSAPLGLLRIILDVTRSHTAAANPALAARSTPHNSKKTRRTAASPRILTTYHRYGASTANVDFLSLSWLCVWCLFLLFVSLRSCGFAAARRTATGF